MTDIMQDGVYLPVKRLLLLGIPDSFSSMVQWSGRVSRREAAEACVYVPRWMVIDYEDEIEGRNGAKKMD